MIADNPKLDHKILVKSDYSSSLGSIAHIPAAHDIQAKKAHHRTKNYKLMGFAQHLLIKHNVLAPQTDKPHRTRFCHARISYGKKNVVIKLSRDDLNSEAKISNVQTCGCLWSCPVCAEAKAIGKAQEIRQALQWADANKILPVMVALTARHHAGMRLADFKKKFQNAFAMFTNHRQWRKFKKEYGFKHKITNREITHGKSGWHYHMHLLLFLDKFDLRQAEQADAMQEALREHWMHCLTECCLDARPKRALVLNASKKAGEFYLTKLGISEPSAEGELAYELTGKGKLKSRTIWDILRHAYYGDETDELLYIEYVKAMTGSKWITWSKGLHDLVNEFVEESEESEETEVHPTKSWLNISNYWWTLVKIARAYHIIIDVSARTRDIDAVRLALHTIRSDLLDADLLPEHHSEQLPIRNSIADVWFHEEW